MTKEEFKIELENLKVYDAHTHLVGAKLCASDFWEIAHYFWFLRELQGAGYPVNYDALPENDRVDAFLSAYLKTKGTGMHYAVRRIFADLYGLELNDKKSVYTAIEKVKEFFSNSEWAKKVTGKGNIRYAVVNKEEDRYFKGLDDTCVWMPRIDSRLHKAAEMIFSAEPEKRAGIAAGEKHDLVQYLSLCHAKGAKAFMTTLRNLQEKTWQNSGENFESIDACYIFMLHTLCGFALERGTGVQFFLGIEHGYCSDAAPVNRHDRILNLYGLFEKYDIKFDLVVASEANNMDAVQAAHIFRKVHVGGMWWFNFRPSTYLDSMAKRFEVLASTKTYLSISDSRCIEWCYGKNMLIKKLAGDFLAQKVDEGYIGFGDALEIAGDWLFSSPEKLYGTNGGN